MESKIETKGKTAYLAIIYSEIYVVKSMMCRSIDDLFKWMTSNHIRVMNLEFIKLVASKTVSGDI